MGLSGQMGGQAFHAEETAPARRGARLPGPANSDCEGCRFIFYIVFISRRHGTTGVTESRWQPVPLTPSVPHLTLRCLEMSSAAILKADRTLVGPGATPGV